MEWYKFAPKSDRHPLDRRSVAKKSMRVMERPDRERGGGGEGASAFGEMPDME